MVSWFFSALVILNAVVVNGAVGPKYLSYDCADGCCTSYDACITPNEQVFGNPGALQACLDVIPTNCRIQIKLEFYIGSIDLLWAESTQNIEFPGSAAWLFDTTPIWKFMPDLTTEAVGRFYNITSSCKHLFICHPYGDLNIGCADESQVAGNVLLEQAGAFRALNWNMSPYLPGGENMIISWMHELSKSTPTVALKIITRLFGTRPGQAYAEGNWFVDPISLWVENCATDVSLSNGIYMTLAGTIPAYGGYQLPAENQLLGLSLPEVDTEAPFQNTTSVLTNQKHADLARFRYGERHRQLQQAIIQHTAKNMATKSQRRVHEENLVNLLSLI